MHFGLLKARSFISAVTGQYNIQPVNGPKLHGPNLALGPQKAQLKFELNIGRSKLWAWRKV